MKKKYYIGVGTTFHDPSIAIINDKREVVFAESTERYLQYKRAMGCVADPAIWADEILNKYCDLDAEFHIATTWSQSFVRTLKIMNFMRLFNKQPKGISKSVFRFLIKSLLPDSNQIWFFKKQLASNIQSGASLERNLRVNYKNNNIKWHRFDHHLSHATMACYSSGFDEAVCLVVDGLGEKGSISYFKYSDGKVQQIAHHKGFESLGFFYNLLTHLCGFSPIKGEEWKVMGMAPYGEKDDVFYNQLGSIVEVKGCNIKFKTKPKLFQDIFDSIVNRVKHSGNDFQLRANLAHTGQLLFSEYMTSILRNLYKKGISDNLIYTGGCALNSAFNGNIVGNAGFKHMYVPSAPADDGNSLGAAYLAYHQDNPKSTYISGKIQSPYLGSKIADEEVKQFIKFSGITKYYEFKETICEETAKRLAEGKLIGWVQGRSEFGPRALGNRSILADPRSPEMKDNINSKVKFREEFRPFAPSILGEYGNEYFHNYQESPYMDRTLTFKEEVRDKVPAVVHLDNTGRLQTVKREWNEKYYDLIKAFYSISGVPVLLNTSFNVMGKPIINSFNDALMVFYNSGLDVLVVNDYLFEK